MKLTQYVVDAFTANIFGGNPAAIIVLENWLDEKLMQQIAAENNLSETAFVVKENDDYRIRWFTPLSEINLCGHATLASAHILYNHLNYDKPQINFQSKSGLLKVSRNNNLLTLDFPTDVLKEISLTLEMKTAFKITPQKALEGKNIVLLVFANQTEIENLNPDFDLIKNIHPHGIICTAKGNEVDFVSRCFYPNFGVNEDPVTGSAHTALPVYWATLLNKNKFSALQLSKRKGELWCELINDRALISGNAVTFLKAVIDF
jgi:PhzF family phenazine biosynthesis protein